MSAAVEEIESPSTAPTPQPIVCPEPGVYENIPASDYHRWPAASSSILETAFTKSWLHARKQMLANKQTPSMLLGDATHAAVLQPALFDDRFVAADQCSGSKRDGQRCSYGGSVRIGGRWYCGTHAPDREPDAGFICLSSEQMAKVEAMRREVQKHEYAAELLAQADRIELSFVWDQQVDGASAPVRCKGRADAIVLGVRTCWDLKTTTSAKADDFERSIWEFAYFIQAAMYLDGLRANGIDLDRFAFLTVESDDPHAVGVHKLDETAVEAGRWLYRQMLPQYAQSIKTGLWLGYGKLTTVSLPAWGWQRLKDLGYQR
jgi:hypothetical protein